MTPRSKAVARPKRKSEIKVEAPRSSVEKTRIRRPPLYAEIIADKRSGTPVYHCCVQREASTAILFWGQYATFEEARADAELYLQRIANKLMPSDGPWP
jgi:hypothetical protein